MSVCTVDGCGKPIRSAHSPYCAMHYHRLYRNGTLETVVTHRETYISSNGYVLRRAQGHPLASCGHYGYEHRLVYHHHRGSGPFSCHWCGNPDLTWKTLHIDHLNDNKRDNRIENLVASCPVCNQARGRHKATASIRQSVGKMLTYNGITKCMSEWSREYDLSRNAIEVRLQKGWSVHEALTRPRGKFGPQSRRVAKS